MPFQTSDTVVVLTIFGVISSRLQAMGDVSNLFTRVRKCDLRGFTLAFSAIASGCMSIAMVSVLIRPRGQVYTSVNDPEINGLRVAKLIYYVLSVIVATLFIVFADTLSSQYRSHGSPSKVSVSDLRPFIRTVLT